MIQSLYLHVPFCASLCRYCAFERTLDLSLIPVWFEQIQKELSAFLNTQIKQNPDFVLKTVYFGGGTPSVLDDERLEKLCSLIRPFLDRNDYEWTMEANPENAAGRMAFFRSLGINRLSIGIQTFHDEHLKRMGRKHTGLQAEEVIHEARKAGFDNLSADLIFAFPWQSQKSIQSDLERFYALDLDHLSIYSWICEENSVFAKSGLQQIDEDLEADEYEFIIRSLKEHGYDHYEISSFARNQRYSRHNRIYWSDELYAGIGFGAGGHDENGYYHHAGSLKSYIAGERGLIYEDDLDPGFAALMMSLRTKWGLNLSRWIERYGAAKNLDFESIMERYPGCLLVENGYLKATEKGMEILNTILIDFLEQF